MIEAHIGPAEIVDAVRAIVFARAQLRHEQIMKAHVGKEIAAVAGCAIDLAIQRAVKEQRAALLRFRQGLVIAGQVVVPGRCREDQLALEGGDRLAKLAQGQMRRYRRLGQSGGCNCRWRAGVPTRASE